jgi:hypothetical protein
VVINQIKDAEKMMKAEEEMLLINPLTQEQQMLNTLSSYNFLFKLDRTIEDPASLETTQPLNPDLPSLKADYVTETLLDLAET